MNTLFRLCAGSVLLIISTQVPAFNPTTTAADIVLHHAGSSSSSNTFLDNIRQNLCVGDADVFVDDGVIANASDGLDSANTFTGNYWVVACEIADSLPGLTPGGGSGQAGSYRLLYYKRDEGGSYVGVLPVAAQSNVAFMAIDAANCPTVNGADNFHVCTGYTTDNSSVHVLAPPNVGTSDVEPEIIDSGINRPSGSKTNGGVDYDNDGVADSTPVGDISTNNLIIEELGYLTFGVVVNTRMYTGLQFDQFEAGSGCYPEDAGFDITDINNAANSEQCMPTMTSGAVTSLFASGRSVDQIEQVADTSNMPADTSDGDSTNDISATEVKPLENLGGDHLIQVCRRAQGSGAQAQHNAFYFNYPCDANQDGVFDVARPATPSIFEPGITVNASASAESSCLFDFNTGSNSKGANPGNVTRWAIGLQPLTRTDSFSSEYRYVKIDGAAPTIENVHAGRYSQWYSQSMQRPIAGGLSAEQIAVLDAIVTNQLNPTKLSGFNITHGFGVGGWLARPGSTTPPTGSLDLNAPVGRFERVRPNGIDPNVCALPRAYDAPGVPIELK